MCNKYPRERERERSTSFTPAECIYAMKKGILLRLMDFEIQGNHQNHGGNYSDTECQRQEG